MDIAGIRDLKAHLSRDLKRVRTGARLVVTDRGRAIATISPADATPPAELEWAARWEVARSAREADVRFSSFDRALNRAAAAVRH